MARSTSLVLLTLSSLVFATGLTAQQPGAGLIFTDVTDQAGVALPDTLTESLAWGDYDGDGDQDLYLTNDGPNNLFRNDGGDVFTDVTAAAGVGHPGFSVGAAFADLDNDGDLDLYIVNFGGGSDVLYRNDGPVGPGGAHAFTDVTAPAGTTDASSSRGVALVDYDRDGLLDIYVNAIGPDILYHNLGNLRFDSVAGALGVATAGQGVGVVATDLDGNGWIDIFTGNRSSDPNRLYLNDQGAFTDVTAAAGITEVGLGMGVLSFDYDNDLDFDLYWTSWPGTSGSLQPNALYENLGDGTLFAEVAAASGTTDTLGWGISCNAADVDNDGWEDMFVTNGFDASSTANVLFLNEQDGTFDDVTSLLGGADFDGRGVAFADYDNDGDLDLCVTGGPSDDTRLWRNDTANGAGWITFDLTGTASNRSAVGARVEVTTDLGTTVKEVSGGAGRGSQNSLPLEFGLGSASAVIEATIRWPSGRVETLTNPGMNRIVAVTEDAAVGCPLDPGDPGYCEQCGPCGQGEGSCRTDDECTDGLVCAENFGALAGFAPRREVCVTPGSVPLPTYDVTELPAVAGSNGTLDSLVPYAINSAGQVVGAADNSDPANPRSSAFRFSPATGMEKLDRRGNDSSAAWAINEAGDVFGVLFAPGTPRRNAFFLYRDAGGYDLLRTGANNAIRQRFELDDMNRAGDLAGAVFSRAKNRYVPYVYTAADGWLSLAGLDTRFREASTRVFRINDRGEALLVVDRSTEVTDAFVLWSGDRLVELGDFGGALNRPGDLNDSGRVAGTARDAEGKLHAYVVRGRGARPVDIHPGSFEESQAVAVSAKGIVSGMLASAGADSLFTWDSRRDRRMKVQTRRRDFATLLDASETLREIEVVDVNERLELVGQVLADDATSVAVVRRFFYFSPPYGLVDLQQVLSAAGSTRQIADVVAINDWGVILVRFEDGGKSSALVLHPRPESPLAAVARP